MRPALLLHALRTARPRQLRARVLRPVARRRFPAGSAPRLEPLAGPVELWRSEAFAPSELADGGNERLRRFHLQYGESVLRLAREGDAAAVRAAVDSWVEQHPPRPGDAWHPYPLSTRVGNWLAALALAPEAETAAIRESLWRQLVHLERNVEDDILGNHVIRNARALVLGGAAFGTERLVDRGRDILRRELPEQVLSDGGHYERSPVYHLVVLRDLLEIEAAVPGTIPHELLEGMLLYAAALTRPDGNPALFNDGTLDLAPRLELPQPPAGLTVFAETGYAVWRSDDLWLAFDCGPPSPPYLPAHAHADALSFQLWANGKPIVVDPGMSTYEPGAERHWLRGTRAHSTVAIDGRDQFELWGAFRSGPLPRVELVEASPSRLEASVTTADGRRHERTVAIGRSDVTVEDAVSGSGGRIESALPLGDDTSASISPVGPLRLEREVRMVSERLYERRGEPALVLRGRLGSGAGCGWQIDLGS
jgi:uncharacterized heparinase superfamily protein